MEVLSGGGQRALAGAVVVRMLDGQGRPAPGARVTFVPAAGRDVSAREITVELVEGISLAGKAATLRILSHQVAGVRHLGAVIVPHGGPGATPPDFEAFIYPGGGHDILSSGAPSRGRACSSAAG